MTVIYTVTQARKIMGIGVTRIYEELASQRLKAKKSGKRTLITSDAIQEWLDGLPDYQTKGEGR